MENKSEIYTSLHNRYEIVITNSSGEIIDKAVAYNQANSYPYIANGYIDIMKLVGTYRTKYIEPYPENSTIDLTDYWDRVDLPEYRNDTFISCYKTQVTFLPGEGEGIITGIQLYSGDLLVSDASLQDIEGDPIILTYGNADSVTVTAFLYILADVSKIYDEDHNSHLYPIRWYGPAYSVLGGCCGTQLDLLELTNCRRNHNGVLINDGYMPRPVIKYYALSKSPLPPLDRFDFLNGNINSYEIIVPNINHGRGFKNVKCETKGLLRTFVIPGLGAIDMRKISEKMGCRREGMFEGIEVRNQHPCYLPAEYVKENDSSLISITKNAFFNGTPIVRRYKNYLNGIFIEPTEVELDAPYFSDLVEDKRQRRCMGFSQHVPLTTHYVGAETVIPCAPGKFYQDTLSWYGYYLTFVGKDLVDLEDENADTQPEDGEEEKEDDKVYYLKANYAVTGEVVVMDYDGHRTKEPFPYRLEYSYDGVNFFTAVDFNETSIAYKAVYFNEDKTPIMAPIWRIINTHLSGRAMYAANNTTHSDKYVSKAAGVGFSGYDPLFIFVGCDREADPVVPNGISVPENYEIIETPYFTYDDDMGRLDLYHTLVPYNCHENDSYYFCGEITPYEEQR